MKQVGKQIEGQSANSIKKMAIRALNSCNLNQIDTIADIGAGKGELALLIESKCKKVILLDDYSPSFSNPKLEVRKGDLNDTWNIESESMDFVFSLEVVEHIENPRHFFREIKRILKPGGYAFVSSPNNLNLFSRLNFLFTGCHRFFQDSCYPAHISPLLQIDFSRIVKENELELIEFYFNNEDVIPKLGVTFKSPFNYFSNSIGVLFRK